MRALLRLQQLGCRPTMVSPAAPLWQTVHRGCPGLLRGFSSSSDATRGFSSSGDTKLPAVVHPAEARAVRVLTAVLTTLLTPLHRPSDIKDECHRETFDGPERQEGETVLAYADRALKASVARNLTARARAQRSRAALAPVARQAARRPQAVQRGTGDRRARRARGFTQDVLETVVARNGGDAEHAALMMDLLDTDGDGVVVRGVLGLSRGHGVDLRR